MDMYTTSISGFFKKCGPNAQIIIIIIILTVILLEETAVKLLVEMVGFSSTTLFSTTG